MVMMHIHSRLITTDIGVDVVVAAYGGVAVDEALLNLLGLLRCQNEFVCLRSLLSIMDLWIMDWSLLGLPRMLKQRMMHYVLVSLQRHIVMHIFQRQRGRVPHGPGWTASNNILPKLLATTAS